MRHDLLTRSCPLRGMKAISAYMHTAPERLLAWRKRQAFPMQRDRAGRWRTSTLQIDRWAYRRYLARLTPDERRAPVIREMCKRLGMRPPKGTRAA